LNIYNYLRPDEFVNKKVVARTVFIAVIGGKLWPVRVFICPSAWLIGEIRLFKPVEWSRVGIVSKIVYKGINKD
jgi:hypothetical protein